jgi:hypothetical protein
MLFITSSDVRPKFFSSLSAFLKPSSKPNKLFTPSMIFPLKAVSNVIPTARATCGENIALVTLDASDGAACPCA